MKSVRPDESDWPRGPRFTSYNNCCASCTFILLTQKQNDNLGFSKTGVDRRSRLSEHVSLVDRALALVLLSLGQLFNVAFSFKVL